MFSDELLGDADEEGRVLTGPFANFTTMEVQRFVHRRLFRDDRLSFVNWEKIRRESCSQR